MAAANLQVPLKVWIHVEQGDGSFASHIRRFRFNLDNSGAGGDGSGQRDLFRALLTQISAAEEMSVARIRHVVHTDSDR